VTSTMTVLDVLADLNSTLIRSEVRTAGYREALERGCVQAIREHGCSLNDVSAQSGLTVEELRALLARPLPLDELGDLAGTR
jgi:hypothetical protein